MKSMKVLKSLLVLGLLCSANGYVVKAEESDSSQVENLPSSQETNDIESEKVATGTDTETTEGTVVNTTTGKTYSTLQEAVNDAENGATVKLNENVNENIVVAEGKEITLDLAGKILNGGTDTNGVENNKAAILNNGNLTIIDSVGEGMIRRDDVNQNSYYVIDNQGTMNIVDGKVFNDSGALIGENKAGSSLYVKPGGKKEAILNITGGEFEQQEFIVIKNDDHGVLNITDGKFISKESAIQNWSEANITGGRN